MRPFRLLLTALQPLVLALLFLGLSGGDPSPLGSRAPVCGASTDLGPGPVFEAHKGPVANGVQLFGITFDGDEGDGDRDLLGSGRPAIPEGRVPSGQARPAFQARAPPFHLACGAPPTGPPLL